MHGPTPLYRCALSEGKTIWHDLCSKATVKGWMLDDIKWSDLPIMVAGAHHGIPQRHPERHRRRHRQRVRHCGHDGVGVLHRATGYSGTRPLHQLRPQVGHQGRKELETKRYLKMTLGKTVDLSVLHKFWLTIVGVSQSHINNMTLYALKINCRKCAKRWTLEIPMHRWISWCEQLED